MCFDTCHVFSAGYKIQDYLLGIDQLLLGSDYPIKLIHLNDSEKPIGSRVDRHANIGRGYLFSNTDDTDLISVLQFATKKNIAIILETNPQYNESEIVRIQQLIGQMTTFTSKTNSY